MRRIRFEFRKRRTSLAYAKGGCQSSLLLHLGLIIGIRAKRRIVHVVDERARVPLLHVVVMAVGNQLVGVDVALGERNEGVEDGLLVRLALEVGLDLLMRHV